MFVSCNESGLMGTNVIVVSFSVRLKDRHGSSIWDQSTDGCNVCEPGGLVVPVTIGHSYIGRTSK